MPGLPVGGISHLTKTLPEMRGLCSEDADDGLLLWMPQARGRMKFYRGEKWDEIKAKILLRDNHACIRCGVKTNLIVHHIRPWSETQDNSELNLVVLCNKHHGTEHNYMKRLYKPTPSVRIYMTSSPP